MYVGHSGVRESPGSAGALGGRSSPSLLVNVSILPAGNWKRAQDTVQRSRCKNGDCSFWKHRLLSGFEFGISGGHSGLFSALKKLVDRVSRGWVSLSHAVC